MASSMFTLPFGKYKYAGIEDVPESYLEWLLEQEFFETDFKEGYEAVTKELEYRNRFSRPEQEIDDNWNRKDKKTWKKK